MTTDRGDYLLGTHDEELRRLGLQHHVWRARVLDAWRRAGVRAGSTVIDAGAGPGWATADLAESVGPGGRVWALERSDRYIDVLSERARVLGHHQVTPVQIDLAADALPVSEADVLWMRWVLCFLAEPARVLAKLAQALRPGGVAVLHEYVHWETHALYPAPKPAYDRFVRLTLEDWRASGGEPNVGRDLPRWCEDAGLRVREVRALGEIVRPSEVMWNWPAGFARSHARHLVAGGKADAVWADALNAELDAAERDPASMIVTPYLMEVTAERD